MRSKQNDHGVADLGALIERIMLMSTEELTRAWRTLAGRPAPANLPKSLSVRLLAYQLQTDRHGGLGKEAVRLLDVIASDLAAGKTPDIKPPMERYLKPGTVLVREHRGVQHRVMVMAEGYAWAGKTFMSLSSAAKAITGTNWNGNTFFGVGDRKIMPKPVGGEVSL